MVTRRKRPDRETDVKFNWEEKWIRAEEMVVESIVIGFQLDFEFQDGWRLELRL